MTAGEFTELVRELLLADPRIADAVPVRTHPAQGEPRGLHVSVAFPIDLDFTIEVEPA